MQTIYKPDSFITFVDFGPNSSNKTTTFTKDNPFYAKVVELYKHKKFDEIKNYFDLKNYVFKYSQGRVKVGDNFVLYDDKEIHNEVGKRILQFLKEGIDIDLLVKFLENLMQNPEEHVKEDLFKFLENNKLPITDDGGFIAYKLVKDDYSPYYQSDASERYYVGTTVKLDRSICAKGREECGGASLYFARQEYWNGKFDEQNRYTGDGRMLIVKIMPQNVVSVPLGEDGRKGKCCEMEVLSEYESMRNKVMDHAVFSVKQPEIVDENMPDNEAFTDSIDEESPEQVISEVIEKIDKLYQPKRDNKGRFISKKASMPKRDKFGRFIPKRKR